MEIKKIYKYALNREIEGKRFYEENAGRLSHAAAINAFQQLALEEQKHIEFIQNQIDLLNIGKSPDTEYGVTLDTAGFFSQRKQSELVDQSIAEAMVPDLPILRMAYLIEKDFADFYENSSEQIQGEAKNVLVTLAKWERIHEALFKRLFDQAYDVYNQMPWGG